VQRCQPAKVSLGLIAALVMSLMAAIIPAIGNASSAAAATLPPGIGSTATAGAPGVTPTPSVGTTPAVPGSSATNVPGSLTFAPNLPPGAPPSPQSCYSSTYSYTTHFTIDTTYTLCMVQGQGYVCNFQIAVGNFLNAAFTQLKYTSGECDTHSTSYHFTRAYYTHTGGLGTATAYGPNHFGTPPEQASGPVVSHVEGGEWFVCMERTYGSTTSYVAIVLHGTIF
jgi:hypothetical protein